MIFETHAHVHDAAFDADRENVLQRARDAGIGRIVTVGCDLRDSRRACEVAQQYGLEWSIGIHPHEAKDAPLDVPAAFDRAIAAAPSPPLAVGEAGLDYYYRHSVPEAQQTVMRAQIRYARARKFPVIFHHRDAFEDFVRILTEEWDGEMRGVVHCFTGNAAEATELAAFGLWLGIGGIVTFKNARALQEAVGGAGLGRIVLETDCPYLAPVPQRGRRNEPAYIVHTLETVARLLGAPPADVARATHENAEQLFRRS
ncbi:MAG: TatD family hydrolase [Candidatus Eremiobacteraeota bacterium]|nr:TatD family hydrolase [Candidatus Eremiobacteraeota bacterium]